MRRMWRLIGAVAPSPGLWVEAVRAAAGAVPRRWWRRPPFLPVPAPGWLAWRVATAYGDAAAAVEPEDVADYLRWRRRQRRAAR